MTTGDIILICFTVVISLKLVYSTVKIAKGGDLTALQRRLDEEQKAHTEMRYKLTAHRQKHNDLIDKWNHLVRRITDAQRRHSVSFDDWERGHFPSREVIRLDQSKQFNTDEINTLIRLCHPDKHRSSETATRITQKLMSMRK